MLNALADYYSPGAQRIVTSIYYHFTFEVVQIIGKVDSALRPCTGCHGSLGELDVPARDGTSIRDPLVAFNTVAFVKQASRVELYQFKLWERQASFNYA